jgi:hypothetical protein
MRTLILAGVAALMLAGIAGPTLAAPAAAPTKLVIAMHDPGCHWFYLSGGPNHRQYAKTVARSGPVTLLNLDEATLKVVGPGGLKTIRVGATLTLKMKGLYKITMVGQAPDDNHLKVTLT